MTDAKTVSGRHHQITNTCNRRQLSKDIAAKCRRAAQRCQPKRTTRLAFHHFIVHQLEPQRASCQPTRPLESVHLEGFGGFELLAIYGNLWIVFRFADHNPGDVPQGAAARLLDSKSWAGQGLPTFLGHRLSRFPVHV